MNIAVKTPTTDQHVATLKAAIEKRDRLHRGFDKIRQQHEQAELLLAEIDEQLDTHSDLDERVTAAYADNLKADRPTLYLPVELMVAKKQRGELEEQRAGLSRAVAALGDEVNASKARFIESATEVKRAAALLVSREAEAIAANIEALNEQTRLEYWKLAVLARMGGPNTALSEVKLSDSVLRHVRKPVVDYSMPPVRSAANNQKFSAVKAGWRDFVEGLVRDEATKLKF